MSITREVSLWLNNTEADYRAITAMARDCLQTACDNESHARTARNDAAEVLASGIEEYVCSDMPCRDGMWGSIINSAIQSIDFEEIATSFLDDLEIWSVLSSDSEDAELFTDKDLALERLCDKVDRDSTEMAGVILKIQGMGDGGKVDIEGTTYCLVRQ